MSERVRQFERQRKFECEGKVSTTLQDVLPDVPVVRRYWREPQIRLPKFVNTMFHRVSVYPHTQALTTEEQLLVNLPNGTLDESMDDFCERFIGEMVGFLTSYWRQGGFHIVFYEGDHASCIVLKVLQVLQQEWGDARFGKVLFVSYGSLCDTAEQVLGYLGWLQSQCVMLRDPQDWLYPPADISSGRYFNGSHQDYPVCYPTLIAALRAKGHIPESASLQVISPFGSLYSILGANSVMHSKLEHMMSLLYHSSYAIPLGGGDDVLYPMLSYDVIKVVLATSVRNLFWSMGSIVRFLDGKLADFPVVRKGTSDVLSWPPLPDDVYDRMCEQYRQSWYGKSVYANGLKKYATRTTSDNQWTPWYSLWTGAAYCEYLIGLGYKLQVAG